MKDCLDREISVGDQIVYPNRHGSRMWLCNGVVDAVKNGTLKVKRGQKTVTVRKLSHVAVIKPVGEVHVVGGEVEHTEPDAQYPLSALGVPIKPGDRGVIMKWDKVVDGLLSWDWIMHNCNKPVTVDIKLSEMQNTKYITVRGDKDGFVYPAECFFHADSPFRDCKGGLSYPNKLGWIAALRTGQVSSCVRFSNQECVRLEALITPRGPMNNIGLTFDQIADIIEYFL